MLIWSDPALQARAELEMKKRDRIAEAKVAERSIASSLVEQ
jgi:hypothetical protein